MHAYLIWKACKERPHLRPSDGQSGTNTRVTLFVTPQPAGLEIETIVLAYSAD